jgi:DNA-directed RNA polymerase specialized sigma24 family protein
MASELSTGSIFPRTDWAELGKAAADDVRLDQLIRLYWHPLKIFLIATFPNLQNQAETLLQDFAQDRLLKEGWLLRADQNRGRFRDFLKASLRNFVLDYLSRVDVKHPPVSLDELEQELPQATNDQSEAFDLAWARTVLAETLRRMELDCKNPLEEQPRRTYIWEMFRLRLLEPVFNDAEPPAYEQMIEQFGLKSPTDASNTLLSAKRIFKVHLNKVIKEYAGQDAATATEIQALEDFLGRLARRG